MTVLADTSVWVDHLHRSDPKLRQCLEANQVGMHTWVLGELACGSLKNRKEILDCLTGLQAVPPARDAEVLGFIEREGLYGVGLGWVDVHLLAACKLANIPLWTRDKRLKKQAEELGLAYPV